MNKSLFIRMIISFMLLLAPCAAKADDGWQVTVHSANGQYYARTIPTRHLYMGSALGQTDVYSTVDSTLLYSLPWNLTDGYLFLSNDGSTLVHMLEYEYSSESEPVFTHAFTVYVNGEERLRYHVSDIVDPDSEGKNYLFPNTYTFGLDWKAQRDYIHSLSLFDSSVLVRPAYNIDDTVYFYTSDRRLASMPLSSLRLSFHPYDSIPLARLQEVPLLREKKMFHRPSDFLQLSETWYLDGMKDYFASKMGMVAQGWVWFGKYKYYYLDIILRVERDGSATVFSIKNPDNLSERRIRKIVRQTKFYTGDFPEETDYWYQSFSAHFRKRNRFISRMERNKEIKEEERAYRRRLVADTIEGHYIPRNLEDCFRCLDTMLPAKSVDKIRNLGDRGKMSEYHHSMGMWIRNNWGLWGGSRLKEYFTARGIYHPDNMSGRILRYYYDYLQGQDTGWRHFDTTLVPPPPPDTATRPLPKYAIRDKGVKRIIDNIISEEEGDDRNDPVFLLLIPGVGDMDADSLYDTLYSPYDYRDSATYATYFHPEAGRRAIALCFETWTKPGNAVVYGYCRYRKHTVFLCNSQPNPRFFRRTGKQTRWHHSLWKCGAPAEEWSVYSNLYIWHGDGWQKVE